MWQDGLELARASDLLEAGKLKAEVPGQEARLDGLSTLGIWQCKAEGWACWQS